MSTARHRAGRPAPGPAPGSRTPTPGTRLIATGAVLFGIGLVFVAAVFVPFFFGRDERGAALSLATFLTVVGFGLGLAGLYRQGRAGRITADD